MKNIFSQHFINVCDVNQNIDVNSQCIQLMLTDKTLNVIMFKFRLLTNINRRFISIVHVN